MAIILNEKYQAPYINGTVGEVRANGKLRWPRTDADFAFVVDNASFPEVAFRVGIKGTGKIEWGDGTETAFNTGGWTYQTFDHMYDDPTEYTVKMTGNLERILPGWSESSVGNPERKHKITRVLTPFPRTISAQHTGAYLFHRNHILRELPIDLFRYWHPNNVTMAFAFCSSLAYVGPLFRDCPDLNDYTDAFEWCSSLETVSPDLFGEKVGPCVFTQAFAFCGSLREIPATLFDRVEDATRFGSCFIGGGSITGPVPELWNQFPAAEGGGCFFGCTGASNYASIPAEWK